MSRFLIVILVGVSAASPTRAQPDWSWSAGVAAVDITPDYPVRLSGFGFRRHESEGITHKIWAKALALQWKDQAPAVVIAVDNLGIPTSMRDEVAKRLQRRLSPERLAFTASHTHTAPMLTRVAPTLFGMPIPPEHQKQIDRYTAELTANLERAALAALKDMRPARLDYGVGTVRFAINRRTQGGPVDHALPLVAVYGKDDKLRAVWLTYACHCVTLSNNKISGDWAGYAQQIIEENHPGAVALVSIGCGADQNPSSGVTGDKVDICRAQGAEIANEVRRLLGGFLAPIRGALETKLKTFELPLAELPTKEQWQAKTKLKGPVAYHAAVNLARLERGETLPTKIDYSVQTWTFGDDLAMVFLPGEVVVDYALRLKKELDGRRLVVHAYANDSPCYIPSERVLKEGGYEGGGAMIYYDLPGPLKAGLEDKIVGVVKDLVGPKFATPIDPQKCQTMPLSPQQSLATIRVRPGLKVELALAEPLIVDPVAIDFGPDGSLWVAEMFDYPLGLKGNYEPGGRVKLLKASGAQPRYDTATVFLDGIPFPTGVMAYKKGVLICAAPDILYAEDTDGDGRADRVQKLFSGFGTGNYQGRVNSLQRGLDGWIYGSCGLFGGTITSHTGQVVPLGDRDFRIKPEQGILEPATGRTQQGRVRDDWDNWFGCDNSTLCRHYPLPDHYLRRNPHVPVAETAVYVPDYPDSNRLFPAGSQQLFKLSGRPGGVTAACGLGIYRDDLLGADYRGNAFVCEPVNMCVHRLVLSPKGSTFSGRRAADEQASEFLAATDPWFRPVQAVTGPDGALWIVDMYRYVIEHPRWIPPEELAKHDLRAGSTLGRLYRVIPDDANASRGMSATNPADLATPQLVDLLASHNGVLRDQALRLLLERRDPETPPLLEKQMRNSRATQARLLALCLLAGLERLQPEHVVLAATDPDPGVRRHAVRLAEPLLDSAPQVAEALARLQTDTDPQVRLQLAFTLGASHTPQYAKKLAALAAVHLSETQSLGKEDVHRSAAILSSVHRDNVHEVAAVVFAADRPETILRQRLAGVLVSLDDARTLNRTMDRLLPPEHASVSADRLRLVALVLEAGARRQIDLTARLEPGLQARLHELVRRARTVAADERAAEATRNAALELLGRQSSERHPERLTVQRLLSPRQSTAVQGAALQALGRLPESDMLPALLSSWHTFTPSLKNQGLELLLSRESWTLQLLDAVHMSKIPASDIDPTRRQRLIKHKQSKVAALAAQVFDGAAQDPLRPGRDTERQKVIERYATLRADGDANKGREIFRKHCAACHRLGPEGQQVGPDMTVALGKPREYLLIEILDPSRNLDSRYVEYVAATAAGRSFHGVLAAETSTSVTLRGQEGKEEVLLRSELEHLASTGRSLMPEGFEKEIGPDAMADLIALLTQAPPSVEDLAKQILDDSLPAAKRQQLVNDNIGRAAPLLGALVADLQPDAKEEYRRIPWIWRVTVAAGKKNDAGQLRDLLEISLPKTNEPLRDWQAVVLGGGIINGISLAGDWPGRRLDLLVKDQPQLAQRWRTSLSQAATMADDHKVPFGTRYDALRMIALDSWDRARPALIKYLDKNAHPELQQGAVSGLADVEHAAAGPLLVEHLSGLTPDNRKLAIDALVKTAGRAQALLNGIEAGRVPAAHITAKQQAALLRQLDAEGRRRAEKLVAPR